VQKIVSEAMSQKNTLDRMRQQTNGGDVGKRKRDMTGEQIPPSGSMEGGGAYNNNAKLQASGGVFALPHALESNTTDLPGHGGCKGR
jgi:hypothetical protein